MQSDYLDLLTMNSYGTGTFNWTDLPQIDGYTQLLTPNGTGIYTINYAFLTPGTISSASYQLPGGPSYGTDFYSDYYTAYNPSFITDDQALVTPVTNAIQAILAASGTAVYTEYFSDVAKVVFAQDTTDANLNNQIEIGATTNTNGELSGDGDAASLSKISDSPDVYGDIWLNEGSFNWADTSAGADAPGTEAFEVLLHEFGHSLGLQHPNEITGPVTNNSAYYTVMTEDHEYLPGMSTQGPGGGPLYLYGLQMDDILALQSIYGANYSARPGNTVYGMGDGFSASSSSAFVTTIWDGGGINIIDARSYTGPAVINLNQGEFSSIGPADSGNTGGWNVNETNYGSSFDHVAYDNVAIANGTIIQNVIGTQGADILIGNLWNNVIAGAGTGGANTIMSDQTIYDQNLIALSLPSLGSAIDWSHNDNPTTVGSQWAGPTISGVYIPLPTVKSDVLIGYGDNNTFYVGKAFDVIDGGYNHTDITNAAYFLSVNVGGALSGWGTSSSANYWDSANQITASDGIGAALSDIGDSSANTGNMVSYQYLSAEDPNVQPIGPGNRGLYVVAGEYDQHGNPEYTVYKGVAYAGNAYSGVAYDGVDQLINVQQITGSTGPNTFYDTGPITSADSETLTLQNFSSVFALTPHTSGSGGTVNFTFSPAALAMNSIYIEGGPEPLPGIYLTNEGTSVAGFNGDDVLNITGENPGSTVYTSINLDLTQMAAGTGMTSVNIGGMNINGEAFADAIAADDIPLGTNLSLTALQYYLPSGSLNPMPVIAYDDSGNVAGIVAPASAPSGAYVNPDFGMEIDHNWVVLGIEEALGQFSLSCQTYLSGLALNAASSDVRIGWSGPGSDTLTVYEISEGTSFSVSDFTQGRTIDGIGVLAGGASWDLVAENASGVASAGAGNYTISLAHDISLSGSISVTYYMENIAFSDGTSWNMQSGPLTFSAGVNGEEMYGRDNYGDTLVASMTDDFLHAGAGTTTLVAGAGATLYNGTGTDTDLFTSGASPTSNIDWIEANTSGGTANIYLQGINPDNVTLFTDAGGHLFIQYTSSDRVEVFDGSFSWSTGVTLPTGEITFDSSYSTTINLNDGLVLTAASNGQTIYGTASGGDTLVAANTNDFLYAFGGTETLVGNVGASLYNGTGTDTDVLTAGASPTSNIDWIMANTSGGTAHIYLEGINPTNVSLWDDSSGHLWIQYTSSDRVEVWDGSFSWSTGVTLPTGEITFDSSYSTTINMDDGLVLTAASYGQTIYGTASGGDTLVAANTNDFLYAFGGTETLVGNVGATLYNGTGTDTDILTAGASPTSNIDWIEANTSGGTAHIYLEGINPINVAVWDDTSGHLWIQYSSTDRVEVFGGSFNWTSGFTLNGVSEVTFDSGYSTTWDMTGGLTLTATSDCQSLYGTSVGGDTLTALGNNDTLYAFAGNNTLTGANSETNNLYGGSGNDTFIDGGGTATNYMYAGSGVDTFKVESASSSTDIYNFNSSNGSTIHIENVLSGYDPVADALANWVQTSTSGSNTIVSVDTTGSGHFTSALVTIEGVTGLGSAADMVTHGQLVVHA